MPTVKSLAHVIQLTPHDEGKGFKSVNLSDQLGSIDPFIILGDFWMPQPFFPPHPHAGFSVMTYMHLYSEGAFINRDSLGDHSRIEPGAIHWTQAGSGVEHEEIPEVPGQACHGLQMWVNHASADRLVPPKAMHTSSYAVPEMRQKGVLVRVIACTHQRLTAERNPLAEITLLDIHLDAGSQFQHDVPAEHISFVMVLKGQSQFDLQDTSLAHMMCGKFEEPGDIIQVRTTNHPVSFLLGTGRPFGEPTILGGPFVMNTTSQIQDAYARFRRGEFVDLQPSPVFASRSRTQ